MKFRFLNGDFDSGKAQIILDQSVDCLKDIVLKKQKAQERLVRKKFETKFYAAKAAQAAAAAAAAPLHPLPLPSTGSCANPDCVSKARTNKAIAESVAQLRLSNYFFKIN